MTPTERLMTLGLSKEAAETAVGMIHDAINQGRCMGMDEGIVNFKTREKHPWRNELEAFFGYVDPDAPQPAPKLPIPIGSRVLLRRGGHDAPAPGQYRYVKATYLGPEGAHHVECRLEEDDADATAEYCKRKGEEGYWSRSIMCLDPAP